MQISGVRIKEIRAMGLESRIKQVESVEHGDLLG